MDSSTPEIYLPKKEDTIREIFESITPLSLLIFAAFCTVIILLIRLIMRETDIPGLPRLRKDMTVAELRYYDGTNDDGRVLVAVNGWIFDVTPGKRFYGPGGRYAAFGGTDASRGLATFSVTTSDKEYDDLSDLNSMEMESVKEWEAQFREKYALVGRLLKPGEEPMTYSDEDSEDSDTSSAASDDDRKDK